MSNGKHRKIDMLTQKDKLLHFKADIVITQLNANFGIHNTYSDRATVNKVDSHQYNFNRNMAITKAYT